MGPRFRGSEPCSQYEHSNYVTLIIFVTVLFIFLFVLYVLFFKWVFEGNLDLPRFGVVSQIVFNCFPERKGKKEDKSVLEENRVETKLEKPTRHWSLDIFNMISIPIL